MSGAVHARTFSPIIDGSASAAAATNFHQWRHFSEPLWFAVMCREIWGPNAAKELRFYIGDRWSERTYRAWASGDNEPPSSVLAALFFTPDGGRVQEWIMRDNPSTWWREQQILCELGVLAARIGGEIAAITKRE